MREKKETPSLQNLIAEELRRINVIYSPPSEVSEMKVIVKQNTGTRDQRALASL
ncbi:MAG: hypothetical protein JSS82_16000 [Bacteroidetes bacterium]|nr:hypothetical protein [Bacteroidota bacterium]